MAGGIAVEAKVGVVGTGGSGGGAGGSLGWGGDESRPSYSYATLKQWVVEANQRGSTWLGPADESVRSVPRDNLEGLIGEAEFEHLFVMTRAQFDCLPKWRRTKRLKELGLF